MLHFSLIGKQVKKNLIKDIENNQKTPSIELKRLTQKLINHRH